MYLLYLTAVNKRSTARSMRAIRNAQRILAPGDEPSGLTEALSLVEAMRRDGEAVVGGSEHQEAADEALEALNALGCAGRIAEGDPPEVEPEPEEEDAGVNVSYEAMQTAMVMLAATRGVPTLALAAINSLAMVTDDDLYREAAAAILDTFPMRRSPLSDLFGDD